MGMIDGNVRFKALDELSESMSESESDVEQDASKRRKIAEPDEPAKPKWSNPDPYTALPPTFEPDRKKTDVVQFIRKAKVVQAQETAKNAIADNADFVSLAFSDDEEDEEPLQAAETQFHANVKELTVTPHRSNAFEEDELPMRPPPPPKGPMNTSRKRKLEKMGDITYEWTGSTSVATPWKQPTYPSTTDMNWRLHQEIMDFQAWVKPMPCEERVREHLITRIEDELCRGIFRDCRIRAFGSFASGLYLPTGDMDLVLVSRSYERGGRAMPSVGSQKMHIVLRDLTEAGIARKQGAQVIHKAKVPIIKFVDQRSGLKVDISFENTTGVVANTTYSEWKSQYPDMPFLVCIIKQFLLMRNLNEVFSGGLGGFSITCLVVSFLQMQSAPAPGSTIPARNLGELLIDFFDFYGKKFDMTTKAISLRPPGHIPKPAKVSFVHLACEDVRVPCSSCVTPLQLGRAARRHWPFASFSTASFECETLKD